MYKLYYKVAVATNEATVVSEYSIYKILKEGKKLYTPGCERQPFILKPQLKFL